MNISNNIQWIMEESNVKKWKIYKNRSYRAKIQKAGSSKIYNVKDAPGMVYNILEDSFEKVGDSGFVITGVYGEMWPVSDKVLSKYKIDPEDISDEPVFVDTVETDTVFAGIMIPLTTEFTLEVSYGEKAILKGNRPEIGHKDGDYVIVEAKIKDGHYVPDFEDSGRIINGEIFEKLYKPL